jgi:hypothetical protein
MILLAALLAVLTPTPTPSPVVALTLPRLQTPPMTVCQQTSWLDPATNMICSAMLCDGEPLVDIKCTPTITK